MQFGIRAENTNGKAVQSGNRLIPGSAFTKSYTDFFPSVFLSYKLDSAGSKNLNLSLGRRISRPGYQMLNPFVFFRNQLSYSTGNPDLDPQFQNRVELRYQHRQWFSAGISYNSFTDVKMNILKVENGVFISRPENIARGYIAMINSSANIPVTRWWKLNANIRAAHLRLDGMANNQTINPATEVYRIDMVNMFTIGKQVNAELAALYASRDLNAQEITGGMYRVNAALQKKIMKEKGSIKIAVEDVFHSWKQRNRSIGLREVYYMQTAYSDTRRVAIAFTYRFGKDEGSRTRKQHSLDEERSRLEK